MTCNCRGHFKNFLGSFSFFFTSHGYTDDTTTTTRRRWTKTLCQSCSEPPASSRRAEERDSRLHRQVQIRKLFQNVSHVYRKERRERADVLEIVIFIEICARTA